MKIEELIKGIPFFIGATFHARLLKKQRRRRFLAFYLFHLQTSKWEGGGETPVKKGN